VYYLENIIKKADPNSFDLLLDEAGNHKTQRYQHITKDKNHVYLNTQIIDSADPKSFEILKGGDYFRDKNSVYFKTTKIDDSDPNTFEVAGSSYTYDKNNAYYFGKIIKGADSETFQAYNDTGWAKDRDFIFTSGRKHEKLKPKTFQVLNPSLFVKDENFVYHQGKEIVGADPQSFQIFSSWSFSRDKNFVYEYEKKLEGENPETFAQERGLGLYGEFESQKVERKKELKGTKDKNVPLLDTIAEGNISKINRLLKSGNDVNYRTQENWFFVDNERRRATQDWNGHYHPLPDKYTKQSEEEIMKEMEKMMKNPDQFESELKMLFQGESKDDLTEKKVVFLEKDTPIFFLAVLLEDIKMMKLLLGSGANVNQRDKDGETVIFIAVRKNNVKIVKTLIEFGANVNVKGKYNYVSDCLLEIARNKKYVEMEKLLLEHGAKEACGEK